MTVVLWGVVIFATVVGLLAIRRTLKLQRQLNQLKRDHYYTSTQMKRLPEAIRDAVHPIRLHLAKVASGGSVPRDMILNGRLYQDVSPEDAQRLWEQEASESPEKAIFVDVRTAKEYAVRRIPGARLVPFDELEGRYKDDIPETAGKVVVYCAAGERSRFACDFLSQRGYTNLYYLIEGLQGWRGPTDGEQPVSLVQIERKAAPTH